MDKGKIDAVGITGCESRFTDFTGFKLYRWPVPPGKNQSACWMMGSMMPTICRDNVVIISVMFLQRRDERTEEAQRERSGVTGQQVNAYGSVWVQSKLGPRTMAMLLGVILLASWYSLSLAKNLIRYLRD